MLYLRTSAQAHGCEDEPSSKIKCVPARSDPSSCPCFCWRPYSQDVPEMLLVGCRSSCSVWSFDGHLGRWTRVADLAEHDGGDVVEDVDWASPCGKTAELVAFARGAAAFVVQLREGPLSFP